MIRLATKCAAAMLAAGLLAGCTTAPKSQEGKEKLSTNVDNTMMRLHQEDPTLQGFLDKSAGYVIFPSVGKGGLLVGGAYGRGILYEAGQQSGYADMGEVTVGLQAGGQQYAFIIAFEKQSDIERFKAGNFRLAANASAVALKSGVARSARFTDGTVVFVKPLAGAMGELAIGGKSLTYVPMGGERMSRDPSTQPVNR